MLMGPKTFKYYIQLLVNVMVVMVMATSICCAQKNNADSLIRLLNKHLTADTVRLNLLNKISAAYFRTDFNNGLLYADKGIDLALKLKFPAKLAEAYYNKAQNLLFKNEFNQSFLFSAKALVIYSKLNDREGMANSYLAIADTYYNLANYTEALVNARKALELALLTKDEQLQATCMNTIGIEYTFLADYTEALSYYLKELKIHERQKNRSGIAGTSINIGVINYYLKQYPECIRYTFRALAILDSLGEKLRAGAALNNIGGAYLEMGDFKKAIYYNQKALVYNTEVKSRKGAANDQMDIGVAYYKLKQYPLAVKNLNEAIAMYDTLGAKNNLSISLGHLAELYANVPAPSLTQIGINPANRYLEALKVQQRAVGLSKQTKDRNNEAVQLQNLSKLYEQQKNFPLALSAYKNYIETRDSVVNDKKKQEIARLTMQYEFDKKEADIKIANDKKQEKADIEIARQKFIRNALIAVGLILVLAAAATFWFYKRNKDAVEQQKEAELKARIADTEMKALRLQLNPHFIFNSLNSINYYISRNNKEMADTYLTKFARLMRMVLENSEFEEISLADDLKSLELYMQMEALRLEKHLTHQVIISEDIDIENTMVPPMLLQPFIENSIWHGIAPKKEAGNITVTIDKKDDMLICAVTDNGIGRKQAAKAKNGNEDKKSFGIKVIKARMDVLNETHNTKAGIEIIDLDEGTKAIVTFPYQLKF